MIKTDANVPFNLYKPVYEMRLVSSSTLSKYGNCLYK